MSPPPTTTLDQAALERLYTRLEKPMVNVVYRWVWDAHEAQDIVQEAFVRVWQRRDEVSLDTIEALLYKAALNLASNRRRSHKVWRWVSLEALFERADTVSHGEGALSRAERDVMVRRAVESLPEPLRRVVVLCELSELSYEQVAELLSVPVGTVGSRRNKALRLLRESLGAMAEESDEAWAAADV